MKKTFITLLVSALLFLPTIAKPSTMTLQWASNPTNEVVDGYILYRSTDGTNYNNIGASISSTATQYVDTVTLINQVYFYKLKAYNTAGTSPFSNVASAKTPWPIVLTTLPTNLTVNLNSSATFTVAAQGDTPIYYQWFKNSSKINGATNATLMFSNILMADAGTYSVNVSNTWGFSMASATLSVINVPSGPVVIRVIVGP
jgi:hypothetical protein